MITTDEYWIVGDDKIPCNGYPNHDHTTYVIKYAADIVLKALKPLLKKDIVCNEVSLLMSKCFHATVAGKRSFSGYDTTMLRCDINDLGDSLHKDRLISDDIAESLQDYIFDKIEQHISRPLFDCCLGNCLDPREIGIDMGWLKVIGDNFTCNDLNPQVCGRMFDFATWADFYKVWTIEVKRYNNSGRRVFWKVPTELLLNANHFYREIASQL